jgi:hypothetical protein
LVAISRSNFSIVSRQVAVRLNAQDLDQVQRDMTSALLDVVQRAPNVGLRGRALDALLREHLVGHVVEHKPLNYVFGHVEAPLRP